MAGHCEDPNELNVSIGIFGETVEDEKFGDEARQNTQFADNGHLFDLDRLRKIANWMSSGPRQLIPTLPAGTYGTISFQQFLNNIANNRTMYGMVRVTGAAGAGSMYRCQNCSLNALGQGAAQGIYQNQIYGLCNSTAGLCSCPAKDDIKAGATICGQNIAQIAAPDNRKIKVKGSLMWDFVASQDNPLVPSIKQGDPIPLKYLPWAPRELYFKVIIPILVNWEGDADNDGAMDNMLYIERYFQRRQRWSRSVPGLASTTARLRTAARRTINTTPAWS